MEKNKLVTMGAILGVSLVLAALIIAGTFLNIRKLDDSLSVSGSAKQAVTADAARWTGNFTRVAEASLLKEGYAQMKADEKAVNAFLSTRGLSGKFEISPVFMYEIYKNDQNAPKEYTLTQNLEVKSDDVRAMKELAKSVEKLVEQGIIFSASPVEYYYNQLSAVRISLLPEVIKDAAARAESIAASSGQRVGTVKSVSIGVVQVMPAGYKLDFINKII